jgi:hypothetical protein
MAKLGAYEYPEIGLLESVELGKKIAREFAGEVSRHGLARTLGMAERGGAFAARIGAMRMWGIANGRSRIRVTREGLRAVNPLSPQEADHARRTLAGQVALFTEMASRMGAGPYDQARLAVLVEEVTGEDRTAVASRIANIDRVFAEARPHLVKRTASTDSPGSNAPPEAGKNNVSDFTPGSVQRESEPAAAGQRASYSPPADRPFAQPSSPQSQPAAQVSDIPRIEISLPDGRLSLPESVSNIDAALTVLWARRQLLAAFDARQGKPTPKPPKEFTGS